MTEKGNKMNACMNQTETELMEAKKKGGEEKRMMKGDKWTEWIRKAKRDGEMRSIFQKGGGR